MAWNLVKDGNAAAFSLFRRHYTFRPNRNQIHFSFMFEKERNAGMFVGPGEKTVLLTPEADALFVWRKFLSADGQLGVNCAVFRNEGAARASDLIKEACAVAWARWPGERLYTYVDARRVARSRTPGRCFLKAGWRYVRGADGKPARTKSHNLLILECLPPDSSIA